MSAVFLFTSILLINSTFAMEKRVDEIPLDEPGRTILQNSLLEASSQCQINMIYDEILILDSVFSQAFCSEFTIKSISITPYQKIIRDDKVKNGLTYISYRKSGVDIPGWYKVSIQSKCTKIPPNQPETDNDGWPLYKLKSVVGIDRLNKFLLHDGNGECLSQAVFRED